MCGRFEQHVTAMHDWVDLLKDRPSEEQRRLKIRPNDMAGTLDTEGIHLRRWSLIPRFAMESKLKYATFNARSETVTEKPAFRDAWKRS